MTDHSPAHAERAEVMRLARAAFAMEVSMIERDARISDLTDDETDSIIDGVLAAARAAALRGRDAVVEDQKAAVELVEWWDTGVLRDGVVRAEAKAMLAAGKADEHSSIQQAERAIIARIVRDAARAGSSSPVTAPSGLGDRP